ncbi:MAG: hypothetical protein HUJ31_06915 [Pseudomonadales bacterium]|nr:hypothetical protein [Pseudomonadales bacterium]
MNRLLIMILTLGITACASNSTDYRRADRPGKDGYRETQITGNRYRVSFKGNRATTPDQVKDYALMRAAELTMLNGHDWFRVVNQETEQDTRTSPATTTSLTAGRHVHQRCGLLGCTTTVTPAYRGGVVLTNRNADDGYSTSIEIVMGDGEVDDPTTVYNARELYEFIDKKYE